MSINLFSQCIKKSPLQTTHKVIKTYKRKNQKALLRNENYEIIEDNKKLLTSELGHAFSQDIGRVQNSSGLKVHLLNSANSVGR